MTEKSAIKASISFTKSRSFNRKNCTSYSYLLLSLVGLIFSFRSIGQTLENESKIIDYLGIEKYSTLVQENPSYLKFLDTRYSRGYYIMDYVEQKMSEFPKVEIIYRFSLSDIIVNGKTCQKRVESKVSPEEFVTLYYEPEFNFLEYRLNFDRTNVTYHTLGNTGKVIMIMPVEQINEIVNMNK
jgi:hypothetical protein